MTTKTTKLLAAAVVAGVFALGSAAQAAPLDCTNSSMTGSSDCEAVAGNDQIGGTNPANWTVNIESLFGFSDWNILEKEAGSSDDRVPVGFSLSGINAKSGSWSVNDNALAGYSDFMITLKGGDGFAAFLFEDTTIDSGNWSIFGDGAELSHAVLYARGTTTNGEVPAPAALGMVLAGLAGLGLMRKKA